MDLAEWKRWRHDGIGSSDAAALYDLEDSFKTRLQLYREKIQSEPPPQETNFILEKGNRLEPIARRHFESHFFLSNGIEGKFSPCNLELDELPIIKASLDGFGIFPAIGRVGIECKYLGRGPFSMIENEAMPIRGSRVPEKYWIQMQHQILVAGLDVNYFVGCMDEKEIRICPVYPDIDFLKKHIEICANFWHCVSHRIEPRPGRMDYKELRAKGAKGLAKEFLDLSSQIKELKSRQQIIGKQLSAMATKPLMTCGGVRIEKTEKGTKIY